MTYSFEVLTSQNTIKATIDGTPSIELRQKFIAEAAMLLVNHSYNKLLVDVTNSHINPTETHVNTFTLINFIRGIGLPDKTRIALVHPEPNAQRKYFSYMTSLESYELKYLPNMDEALVWLQQK